MALLIIPHIFINFTNLVSVSFPLFNWYYTLNDATVQLVLLVQILRKDDFGPCPYWIFVPESYRLTFGDRYLRVTMYVCLLHFLQGMSEVSFTINNKYVQIKAFSLTLLPWMIRLHNSLLYILIPFCQTISWLIFGNSRCSFALVYLVIRR